MSNNEKAASTCSEFIPSLISRKAKVLVFLVNGVKLNGTIYDSDDECIVMSNKSNSNPQLVYKNAISTISPED